MRILVAEDDLVSARTLENLLRKSNYQVVMARDGLEALAAIRKQQFDILLTDWLMPKVDGIQLAHEARSGANPVPIIVFVTILDSPPARAHALDAGADDYVTKPFQPLELLKCLSTCLLRSRQKQPERRRIVVPESIVPAPFVGVCIAASTGGPTTLRDVLVELPASFPAPILVVQHGPAWVLESLAARLQEETKLSVQLAEEGLRPTPGKVYLAPADCHLCLQRECFTLQLANDPPENHVRPAADPLFRSAAAALGRHCLAVVLTGMGCDGSLGAQHVAAAGGILVAQDPKTATATAMPSTVIGLGLQVDVAPPKQVAKSIEKHARSLVATLPRVH